MIGKNHYLFGQDKDRKDEFEMKEEAVSWIACSECLGRGKKRKKLIKKVRLRNQLALNSFEKINDNGNGISQVRPKGHLLLCVNCGGSGLLPSASYPESDGKNYPHVAIIGGGIGGVALAVACLHRGIPFTLYERDSSFDARSQGYGLTLQQASSAIKGFGLFSLKQGVISTTHLVHDTSGNVIVEWGRRLILTADAAEIQKRTNIHIARQSLRLALIEQLGGVDKVQWGHQLINLKNCGSAGVELLFQVNGKTINSRADLVVGADGIRSSVRKFLFSEDKNPLRYLGYMVILGICHLEKLRDLENVLLDSATVFQTVNGNERIYVMPYSHDSVMWQLSFPMSEAEAKKLCGQGAQALKHEACLKANWHVPVPQILSATAADQISGYPVYDRELLTAELLQEGGPITLIGDAAHPMSPFKGQGANQALLDALALGRGISTGCGPFSPWREAGIRKSVLNEFESEMLARSANKVKDSAEAAQLLHSDLVLREGDGPRGRSLKRKEM